MNFKKLIITIITFALIFDIVLSAITVEDKGAINNLFTGANKKQKSDAEDAIDGLKYADCFLTSAKSNISKTKLVRIDMQGTFTSGGKTWHNLQAQINGVKKASTVAHINVCSDLADNKKQKEILKAIHDAFNKSLKNEKSYDVCGTA